MTKMFISTSDQQQSTDRHLNDSRRQFRDHPVFISHSSTFLSVCWFQHFMHISILHARHYSTL